MSSTLTSGLSQEVEKSREAEGETTFMLVIYYSIRSELIIFRTADTSFVSNLPNSSRTSSKFGAPTSTSRPSSGMNKRGAAGNNTSTRGGIGRGNGRGTRGSGLARAKGRGKRSQ